MVDVGLLCCVANDHVRFDYATAAVTTDQTTISSGWGPEQPPGWSIVCVDKKPRQPDRHAERRLRTCTRARADKKRLFTVGGRFSPPRRSTSERPYNDARTPQRDIRLHCTTDSRAAAVKFRLLPVHCPNHPPPPSPPRSFVVAAADMEEHPGCRYSTSASKECSSTNGSFTCETIRRVFRNCPGVRPEQVYDITTKDSGTVAGSSQSPHSGGGGDGEPAHERKNPKRDRVSLHGGCRPSRHPLHVWGRTGGR